MLALDWYGAQPPNPMNRSWFFWENDFYHNQSKAIQAILNQISPGITTADYHFHVVFSHGDGITTDVKKVLNDGFTLTIAATGKDQYRNQISIPILIHTNPAYPTTPATHLFANIIPGQPVPGVWAGPKFPTLGPFGPKDNQDYVHFRVTGDLVTYNYFTINLSTSSFAYIYKNYVKAKGEKPYQAIYDFLIDAYNDAQTSNAFVFQLKDQLHDMTKIFYSLAHLANLTPQGYHPLANLGCWFYIRVKYAVSSYYSWEAGYQ